MSDSEDLTTGERMVAATVLLVMAMIMAGIFILVTESFLPRCEGNASRAEFNVGNDMLGASGTMHCIKRGGKR